MKKMKNEIIDCNDTIGSRLAEMSMRAMELYTKELPYCGHHRAIARALNDTLKEFIAIAYVTHTMDRDTEEKLLQDKEWVSHVEKQAFMHFADLLYKDGNYRVERRGYPYGENIVFSLAVLRLKGDEVK